MVYKKTECCRGFPHSPGPHACTASLFINTTHRNSALFQTKDEPTLTHHHLPRSTVYLKSHPWCCTFYVFGQMDSDIYPSLLHPTEYFYCPKKKKNLCAVHSFLSQPLPFPRCPRPHPRQPCQLLIFLLSPEFFLFQNVI